MSVNEVLRAAYESEAGKDSGRDVTATVFCDLGRGDMYIIIGEQSVMIPADPNSPVSRRVNGTWEDVK